MRNDIDSVGGDGMALTPEEQRIARLEELQTQRIIYIGQKIEEWNDLVDKKQREIDNLKAQRRIKMAE